MVVDRCHHGETRLVWLVTPLGSGVVGTVSPIAIVPLRFSVKSESERRTKSMVATNCHWTYWWK